jgi:hypothetical protein
MKLDPSKTIPTASSNSESWIQWHKDLRRVFGKKKANSIWLYAWSKRGGVNSPANTRSLRNYMDKQGIDITTTNLAQLGDAIGNILSFPFSVGKVLIIGGLSVAGIVLLVALIRLINNPNQNLTTQILPIPKIKG